MSTWDQGGGHSAHSLSSMERKHMLYIQRLSRQTTNTYSFTDFLANIRRHTCMFIEAHIRTNRVEGYNCVQPQETCTNHASVSVLYLIKYL